MTKTKKRSKKRIAFISIFLVLLSAILFVGGYISVCLIKTNYIELKPDAQVYADAQTINADASYLMKDRHIFKKMSRLGYNENTTIKVVLKDSLQEFQKDIIKDVYENKINPLFEMINDNYFFEVVEAKDLKKTSADVVVIYFEHDKGLDEIWGAEGRTNYHFINPLISPFFDKITVTLSKTIGELCIMHEILHTFGLDDVVNTQNYATFLKYDAEHIPQYKPNDIRVLAALYCQGQDFDGLKQWLDAYTRDYYTKLAEHFDSDKFIEFVPIEDVGNDDGISIGLPLPNSHWTQPVEVEVIEIEPFDNKKVFSGGNNAFSLDFEITLENGLFEFIQKDKVGNILYTASGVYYHYGGKIYLGVLHTSIQCMTVKHDVVIINTENGFRLCSIKASFGNFLFTDDISNRNYEKVFLTEN